MCNCDVINRKLLISQRDAILTQPSTKATESVHMLDNILITFCELAMRLKKIPTNNTNPFNGPLSGTTRVSRTRKVKPIWILLKQETASGSGISWAICKSAPYSRQITTPAPHHSVFTGRMPFLPPNQECQSIDGDVDK